MVRPFAPSHGDAEGILRAGAGVVLAGAGQARQLQAILAIPRCRLRRTGADAGRPSQSSHLSWIWVTIDKGKVLSSSFLSPCVKVRMRSSPCGRHLLVMMSRRCIP
jgi:hypothetical protein